MTRILTFLFFCLAFTGLCAQHPFPRFADSTSWNVLYQGMLASHTYPYRYRADTSMCGYTYSVVEFPSIEGNIQAFVRDTSDKVFVRASDSCHHKEYLMYNFSLVQGDTVHVGFEIPFQASTGTDTAAMRVDTVFFQTYNGITRKTIRLNHGSNIPPQPSFWNRYMDWVEGLGSLTHPFYPFGVFYDGFERYYHVLCTDSAGTEIYRNPFFNNCFITAVEESKPMTKLQVWPNPAQASFWVEVPEGTIDEIALFDLNGKLIQVSTGRGSSITELELRNDLNKGTYLIKVSSQGQAWRKLVVVGE